MTIEIDDAGTGDPLLGAVIGFYRQETGELHFEWIPLETYQEGTYRKDLPQEEAAKAVMRGLLKLNIKPDEKVLLCQGSIFNKARESLDKANIKHEPLKVEGVLQDAVEREYIKAVENLGIKSKGLYVSDDNKEKGYRKRYFILLNWAKKKPLEREKFVKTGLNFWKYSRDNNKPIPGGWKKARKEFEEKLDKTLKISHDLATWKQLRARLKKTFPQKYIWIDQKLSSFGQFYNNAGFDSESMKIHLYNQQLSQVYFFLGKGFPGTPGEIIWRAVIWEEESHTVNGIIVYVKRDENYKLNMKWLSFLRSKVKKLLGDHVRFIVRSF
ncbi:MAG: hypothetical protein ACTSVI_00600 [Promethearchaeota archaeon]